jgi:hypothetical protein
MCDQRKFWQNLSLGIRKWFRYLLEITIAVLITELLVMWLGESARWFNNFHEIATYFGGKSLKTEDMNVVMTLLSTHHQSLANLLAIAGVIATVITIIFYLERQDDKEKFEELQKLTDRVRTNFESLDECQQLIDSILLRFWNIQQGTDVEKIHSYLHNSAKIKCTLSKDDDQVYDGLGILGEQVAKFPKEQTLCSEVEQLLRNLYMIGRLSKEEHIGVANGILKSMEKPPLK